jgi:hypothetical protein
VPARISRADEPYERAYDAHQHRRREAHQRCGREGPQYVIEQPLHAAGEDLGFARFGMIALHHAHAAERFRQPAGHVRVDLAALAENRADLGEGHLHDVGERQDERRGEARHRRTDGHQHAQRDQRRHQSAHEIQEAGSDQIAHALDVGHDARDQHSAFVRVVIGHREQADVLLHFLAELRDEPLAGFREQLRQGERGDALDQGRAHDGQHEWRQQPGLALADHVIDQKPRRIGQHQPAQPVDDHQQKAECQQAAPRENHFPEVRPDRAQAFGLFTFRPACVRGFGAFELRALGLGAPERHACGRCIEIGHFPSV